MNKSEKEILEYQLAQEQEVLKKLESQYKRALNDIIRKMKIIQADIDMLQEAIEANGDDSVLISMHRSKVYQKQYQQALSAQITAILEKLHSDEYSTIQAYLNGCYESGYLGALYEIQSQGVPLIFPIDQSQVVAAVQLETKLSVPLYNRLGVDIDALRKTIQAEISRGIATSIPYSEVARNISNAANVPRSNAMRIARTEGGRIQNKAAFDVAEKAKKAGADVVKQWSAALDARTRPSHARLDGEVRELDKKFSNGLMYPKDPSGSAGEVINCRCRMKEVPRWALDSESTKRLGNTDNMTDEQLQPIADKLGIPVDELRKYKNNIIPVRATDYDDFRRQYEKIWNANAVPKANGIAKASNSNYNVREKLNYSGNTTPEIEADIESKLSLMPARHRELAETQISKIEITNNSLGSSYNPKTKILSVSVAGDSPNMVIHEYAHALETALDVYNNKEFKKIWHKGLEKITIADVIADNDSFSKLIFRIESPKFVSKYQGRLYNGFYTGGDSFTLNTMYEYFSEGYTEYIVNPDNLKKHDPDLFAYIERIG